MANQPSLSIKVNGLAKFADALQSGGGDLARNMQDALNSVAIRVRDVSKELIISGRGYTKAPFQTGRMYSTMAVQVNPFEARVFPTVSYALYVHEGLSTSQGYGRRPFLEDSAKENEKFASTEFERAVETTMNTIARESK